MEQPMIMGIVGGLLAGVVIAYFVVKSLMSKGNNSKISEMNAKSDLIIKEAKLSADRILNEANNKADQIRSKSEAENERIKQKKIQEAKDKFARMKSQYRRRKRNAYWI